MRPVGSVAGTRSRSRRSAPVAQKAITAATRTSGDGNRHHAVAPAGGWHLEGRDADTLWRGCPGLDLGPQVRPGDTVQFLLELTLQVDHRSSPRSSRSRLRARNRCTPTAAGLVPMIRAASFTGRSA